MENMEEKFVFSSQTTKPKECILLSSGIKTELIDVCRCCLSENNLKSMLVTHYYNGKAEIYSEMIHSCFSIEIITFNYDGHENTYLICDACISRLRDACFFKSQVKANQGIIEKSLKLSDLNKEVSLVDCQMTEDDFHDSLKSLNSESNNSDIVKEELQFNEKIKHKIMCTSMKKIKKKKSTKNKLKNIDLIKSNDSCDELMSLKQIKLENLEARKRGTHRIKKEKNNTDVLPYKLDKDAVTCEICNETFPLHTTLVRHMPSHFPNHICHICARFFATQAKLKSHILRHKQVLQKCHICLKSYKGSDNLKKHLRHHLTPNVNYKCPHCPERFSVYYKRMKHLVEVHNDEAKKYKCKQCPKKYFQSCTLSRHIRNVHLQERKCVCQECGDAFFDKSGLSEHMLKHTGIKNFQCDVCHKSYGRRFTLTEHMKIHTNDKKFVCPVCSRAFTQKSTLKGHMNIHEKNQILSLPNQS